MKKMSKKTKKTQSPKSSENNKVGFKKGSSGPKKESSSSRRLHVTSPSSASEIRDALGITKSDLEIAREAIESST